jgi:hypothetical protein
LKVFKWIQGTGYGLECTGLAFGSMSMGTLMWINSKSSIEYLVVFL